MQDEKSFDIEKLEEYVSNSRISFISGKYQEAVYLAKKAIDIDSNCADAYQCAANAYMSLSRYDDAIDCYQKAVKSEPDNGNRYFSLGYAQATAEKLPEAMQSFAKADEIGISEDAAAQMYHIIGIVNHQLGRLDDALINLKKSEQLIPVDMDIMKRKAAIYGIKNDFVNGINVANQIKLMSPSDYSGYQIAYILLKQANRPQDAFKELMYARKNLMDFPFPLCRDMVDFEMLGYEKDNELVHIQNALVYIKHYLKKEKPTAEDVVDCYLTAADLYLRTEDADGVIMCLKAAENPIFSYNNGVLYEGYDPKSIDSKSILNEMNANLYKYEQFSVEQLEAMKDGDVYITDSDKDEVLYSHQLSEDEKFELLPEDKDTINRLYIGAYTLLKDYRKVIAHALTLQKSENEYSAEIGLYAEAKAMKDMNADGWRDNYVKVQKKFRNAVLRDPTDFNAMTLRVRCLIDIGEYEEARRIAGYLNKELQESLNHEIDKEMNGGS